MTTYVTRTILFTSGFVIALATAPLKGDQGVQAPPVFRSAVDLIHFDVSVLDKQRRPVRGLVANDFTVLEDGKPQTIATFLAVDAPPLAPAPSAKWMREVSPDVHTNEPEQNPEGRLFVLLIDDGLIPPDPAALKNAKKIARGVIDRLSPSDQVAVVFTFAAGDAQTFTTDRKRLLAAIDSLRAGPASHLLGWDTAVSRSPRDRNAPLVPAVDGDAGLRLGSLRTLQMVADTLIAAPQRRKAVIFISPGVTVDQASDARPVKAGSGSPGGAIREANRQLVREMPRVLERMARANVTMYAFDPCGLDGLESYIARAAAGLPSLRSAVTPPPPFYHWLDPDSAPPPRSLAHHAATLDMDFLVTAAVNTGGRAIVNTNDFDPGLDGIFEENASYYLLGYVKPEKNAAGSLHRVTIKVDRPDVTVRTRNGYDTENEPKPGTNSKDQSPADAAIALRLEEAAAGPVADGELPLQIALAPMAVQGAPGDESAVVIVVGFRQPSVTARTQEVVDLQIGAFTPDGRRVGALQRQTAAFTLVPGRDAIRYEVLTKVGLPPGRFELRVAAHRKTDNAKGSVYADVVVPNFAKAPLSLSGVWLEATPGTSALGRDALASIFPFTPTAVREFTERDAVSACFRIYQGGAAPLMPVPLTIRIVNDHDVVVATASGTVGAERFDPRLRAADHRFDVQVGALPAGRYLLSFEATLDKTTARRDVMFGVR